MTLGENMLQFDEASAVSTFYQPQDPESNHLGAIPKISSTDSSNVEDLPPNFMDIVDRINTGDRVCVILRGLPGSGKSFLANQIIEQTVGNTEHIVSADFHFMSGGVYKFDASQVSQAHKQTSIAFVKKATHGLSPLIVDNNNVELRHMEFYLKVAIQNFYHIEVLEPSTSWRYDESVLFKKSVHTVRLAAICKMKKNFQAGLTTENILNSCGLQAVPALKRDEPEFFDFSASAPFEPSMSFPTHQMHCPFGDQAFLQVLEMFPDENENFLWNLFQSCQFDVDLTASILFDGNAAEFAISNDQIFCTCFMASGSNERKRKDSFENFENDCWSSKKMKQDLLPCSSTQWHEEPFATAFHQDDFYAFPDHSSSQWHEETFANAIHQDDFYAFPDQNDQDELLRLFPHCNRQQLLDAWESTGFDFEETVAVMNDFLFTPYQPQELRQEDSFEIPPELDLHNHNAIEAQQALDKFLDDNIKNLKTTRKFSKNVDVITGKGNHSVNGFSIIKHNSMNRFSERKLSTKMINEGCFRVRLEKHSLMSYHV